MMQRDEHEVRRGARLGQAAMHEGEVGRVRPVFVGDGGALADGQPEKVERAGRDFPAIADGGAAGLPAVLPGLGEEAGEDGVVAGRHGERAANAEGMDAGAVLAGIDDLRLGAAVGGEDGDAAARNRPDRRAARAIEVDAAAGERQRGRGGGRVGGVDAGGPEVEGVVVGVTEVGEAEAGERPQCVRRGNVEGARLRRPGIGGRDRRLEIGEDDSRSRQDISEGTGGGGDRPFDERLAGYRYGGAGSVHAGREGAARVTVGAFVGRRR